MSHNNMVINLLFSGCTIREFFFSIDSSQISEVDTDITTLGNVSIEMLHIEQILNQNAKCVTSVDFLGFSFWSCH